MKRRPIALVAALAAIAVGLFLLWRALGGGAPGDRRSDASGAPGATAASGANPGAQGRLEAPLALDGPSGRADGTLSASELGARTETFVLAGAGWIRGSIRFPEGSPADDSLEVWAFEESVAHAFGPSGPSANDLPDRVRSGELGNGWWSRRPVDVAGSFQVPVPKGAVSAFVLVDGRFLHLAGAQRVELARADDPLILSPALGARLVGRCRVPAAAGPEDWPVGAPVTLHGRDNSPGGQRQVSRSTRVRSDLTFELRGVPAGLTTWLWIEPERLLATLRVEPELAPGKTSEVEFTLILGARVSGRVTDEDGQAISGAGVRLERDPASTGYLLAVGGKTSEPEAATGADGSFALLAIRPGKARILALHEGFVGGGTDELALADGDVRSGLTIELSRGLRISGTVAWPDGSPASGASVHAMGKDPDPVEGFQPKSAKSGARGEFTISGLGNGRYALAANASRPIAGENPAVWTARRDEVAAGASDVALVLREPVGLAGRAVDDQGAAVKSFAITASPAEDSVVPMHLDTKTATFEAADGAFLLAGLEPGTWVIAAEAKGHVQLTAPTVFVPRTEGPLVVVLSRVASASGLVVDPDGQPIAGAELVQASGESFGMFVDRERSPSARTDEKGAFTVEGLSPGGVELMAAAEGFAHSEPLLLQLAPGERLTGLTIGLRRGGRLTGEVFDRNGSHAAGHPVMVMSLGGQDAREARVDGQGAFVLEHLAPGSYQVIAEPTQAEREAMLPRDGEQVDPADLFATMKMASAQIREGETTHVVLGAPPKAPVRVFGTVSRGGEPVRAGMIVCVGEGGSLLSKLKMARIREGGEYELKIDEPGPVVLSLQRDLGRGGTSEYHVTIPEKPEFRVDLEVPTGGIRGIVHGPDGDPLQGIRVSLLRHGGFASISAMDQDGSQGTDPGGRFEFADLAPGVYGLAAGGGVLEPGDASLIPPSIPWGRAVVDGIRVEADKFPPLVEIRLSKPGSIAGRVRGADGSPIANATIFARDESGRVLHRFSAVASDANGRFTYTGIAPGRFVLCARTRTLASPESPPVSVEEGRAAEVELVAGPGTTLLVTVEDKEGVALHAAFTVRDEHGHDVSEMYDMSNIEDLMTEGLSTTAGRIGPLPPGDYRVRATAFDGRSAEKPVSLRGQSERGLKLRIE